MGRYRGALSGVRPDDLAAHVVSAAVQRNGIDPERITDVYLGAANQAGEDNRNVARMAALLAGLPVSVPGATRSSPRRSGGPRARPSTGSVRRAWRRSTWPGAR